MVVTANGEVPAKEEAAVYVRELDLFVTVMLLEKTPAVLSLGKLCEEYGYSYHWTSGRKPHHIINGKKMHCDTSNHVPFVVPGLSASSSTEELQSDELQGVHESKEMNGYRSPMLVDESVPEHRDTSSSYHELLWGREQKWYRVRVRIVSPPTFRRTRTAISA